MFSQSSLASPSSFRRRASTCILSLLFRGFTTFRSVRYCWAVWHAAQFLALMSLRRVHAGQLHCPTFSWRLDGLEKAEEPEGTTAEEEDGYPRACLRALWPEEGVQEHDAVPGPDGRPQLVQQRGRRGCCSWKPCSLEEPQAEHLGAPVGLRSVHFEQAQVLKSGLEGLAGVNRTVSPTKSMRSEPAREDRQASHLEELPGLGKEQLGHFQVDAAEEDWGWCWPSSSSKMLRRFLGYEGSWGWACLGLDGCCGPGWGGTTAVEGEVGLGVFAAGRPGGGTSLLLRGTGLFCREEKGVNGDERVFEEPWGDSWGSEEEGGGESSVRSMSSGADPAVWTGNPWTGVCTSGTTRASGGILGKDSFLGPPHAEQDIAMGVLWRVHRGQAQPECSPPRSPTSPLLSGGLRPSSLAGFCPWGSSKTVLVMVGAEGSSDEGWNPFGVTAKLVFGGLRASDDGPKPQMEQAPDSWGLLSVQRGHAHRCSSPLLSRRILLRSGFWRGASQMEQRGAAPAFRKVQRPQDHSLLRTAAAMEPGEWEWLWNIKTVSQKQTLQPVKHFLCYSGNCQRKKKTNNTLRHHFFFLSRYIQNNMVKANMRKQFKSQKMRI